MYDTKTWFDFWDTALKAPIGIIPFDFAIIIFTVASCMKSL